MELIHYTNNGQQYLDVKQPRRYDEILDRVTLISGMEQAMPWSVIRAVRDGKLPIGRVASVMHAVMERSSIAAEALARAVAELQGYTGDYPEFQGPRDWLSEAADVVSPEFLSARSWTLGEEVVSCNWWADKPDTISLMSPPEVAAAVLKSVDETAAGRLAMLIDIHRDEPEFARHVAACMNRDWQALLDSAHTEGYTPDALALADTHGFLPGVYTFGLNLAQAYQHDFACWAATHPGVSVRFADVGANLYNGYPLTDTAEALVAAYDDWLDH